MKVEAVIYSLYSYHAVDYMSPVDYVVILTWLAKLNSKSVTLAPREKKGRNKEGRNSMDADSLTKAMFWATFPNVNWLERCRDELLAQSSLVNEDNATWFND